MPVPRRHVSLLVNSAANTLIPVYREAARPRVATIKRCQRCQCQLAADQTNHFCSPCARKLNDTPDWVGDLLE